MIREDQFVERMTAHWRTLGNSPSSALQSVWRQLCSTFNEQATAKDRLWRVAQPATGTGKSQGLALYAAMHHNQPQFGMLIVVRLISQAEEMAEQINHLAHDSIAQCRHTKNVLTTKEMADTQILVVTHKAYELSLEKFKRGDEQRFSTFMAYNHSFEGQRNLVVIDESLNIIKQYQCNLEDLSFALGVIPQAVYQNPDYTKELDALKRLETDLKCLQKSEKVETRVLSTEADHLATHCDFTSLRQEVSQTAWDEHVLQSEAPHYRKSLRERVDKTLEAVSPSRKFGPLKTGGLRAH